MVMKTLKALKALKPNGLANKLTTDGMVLHDALHASSHNVQTLQQRLCWQHHSRKQEATVPMCSKTLSGVLISQLELPG
jgi:hypothetical protein